MLVGNYPLVSCVMTTEGRFGLVKKSIECYFKQTYYNKELVIVTQGEHKTNRMIMSYVDSLNRSDVWCIEAPESLSLGAMRNLSVELAHGEIICQWDDDDLYHPARIITQYKALKSKSAAVASLYDEHLKYYRDTNEIYWIDWKVETSYRQFLCGSVMFYKDCFHEFNSRFYPEFGAQSDREEDLNVLQKLSTIGEIVGVPLGHHYIYVYHGDNTYNAKHHRLISVFKKRIFTSQELLAKRAILEDTFKLVDMDPGARVCTSPQIEFIEENLANEEVFVYNPA